MNYIPPDNQRYSKPALLDCNSLQFVHPFDTQAIQEGTASALSHGFFEILLSANHPSLELGHLAYLFIKGHLSKEFINPDLHVLFACLAVAARACKDHQKDKKSG